MASSRKPPRTEAVPAALAACLTRHVQSGQHLVVALSGGIDSVVLLHGLAAAGAQYSLAALHINHGLSPQADRWEAFCHAYGKRLGVPCQSVRVKVELETPDGLEAAARRARHAAFAASDGDWVVLAHQRDDQAETLLFNLLRGAGVAGAAAMRERNGRLLRPLLGVGRADIDAYARTHGLEWVEDESNADIRHTRNFLRRKIFPELKTRFPAATRNFAAAAQRFAVAADMLDALARSDAGCERVPLALERLQALDDVRAANVLRYLLAQHEIMIPGEARLLEAVRQMCTAGPDRHPALRFGTHRLVRRRGRLYLESDLG